MDNWQVSSQVTELLQVFEVTSSQVFESTRVFEKISSYKLWYVFQVLATLSGFHRLFQLHSEEGTLRSACHDGYGRSERRSDREGGGCG